MNTEMTIQDVIGVRLSCRAQESVLRPARNRLHDAKDARIACLHIQRVIERRRIADLVRRLG